MFTPGSVLRVTFGYTWGVLGVTWAILCDAGDETRVGYVESSALIPVLSLQQIFSCGKMDITQNLLF